MVQHIGAGVFPYDDTLIGDVTGSFSFIYSCHVQAIWCYLMYESVGAHAPSRATTKTDSVANTATAGSRI